jgi:amidase
MTELTSLTAVEIVRLVSSREVSARKVVEAFLERIANFNPTVNAICTLDPAALEAADSIDRRLASGEAARALEGVPVVVKDNIETKGLRTTWGSRLMEHHVPSEDAVCIERLRSAGAILLGKTNTPEFAHDVNTSNFLFGTTRNPWNLMVTSGGSSGGSAAAVAAGFAPLAVGTDLGGSIRTPASFNNIVGIRPVPGRVPVYPAAFGWDTLVPHVVGPLAANLVDAALMLSVMAGPDDRDPSSLPRQNFDLVKAAAGETSIAGRSIAYCCDFGGSVPIDPEVGSLVEAAAQVFEGLGCQVEAVDFDVSDLREIIAGTRGFGMIARFGELYREARDLMTLPLKRQIEAALTLDVATIAKAEKMRTSYWHRVRSLMQRFDYIIAPSCGAAPFRLDQPLPAEVGGKPVDNFYDVFLPAYAFTITGLPIAAVPCGFTQSGLPVGIQIIARRQREDLALEAASAYAGARPELFRRPDIDPSQAHPIPAILDTPGMVLTSVNRS